MGRWLLRLGLMAVLATAMVGVPIAWSHWIASEAPTPLFINAGTEAFADSGDDGQEEDESEEESTEEEEAETSDDESEAETSDAGDGEGSDDEGSSESEPSDEEGSDEGSSDDESSSDESSSDEASDDQSSDESEGDEAEANEEADGQSEEEQSDDGADESEDGPSEDEASNEELEEAATSTSDDEEWVDYVCKRDIPDKMWEIIVSSISDPDVTLHGARRLDTFEQYFIAAEARKDGERIGTALWSADVVYWEDGAIYRVNDFPYSNLELRERWAPRDAWREALMDCPAIDVVSASASSSDQTPTSDGPDASPVASNNTPATTVSDVGDGRVVSIDLPLRVNVGGPAFQDRDGNDWVADQPYSDSTGWGYVGGEEANYREEFHGGVGLHPHSSGREGMEAYRFRVPELPQGEFYAVTLDFSGRLDGIDGYGERVFYVTVGETVPGEQEAVVLGPIDPWTAFHSDYVPSRYRVEYIRPVDGVIEVSFTSVIGKASINGITIERQ